MKYDKYRAYINTDKGFYLVDITNTLVDAIDKINSIGNNINYIIIGHDDEQDIDEPIKHGYTPIDIECLDLKRDMVNLHDRQRRR